MTASDEGLDDAYGRSIDLLRRALTPYGFLASPTKVDNYRRIWARDGVIAGLAGIASGESDLVEGMRRTLVTLAENQGPHGEIPSNVDPETGAVSYGTLVGRIDPPLWFLIGIGRYVSATGDAALASTLRSAADRTAFLLGSWEMNNRGLIYVPPGGDWADEYPLSGYNLYDQVLYLRALREYSTTFHDEEAGERAERLESILEESFLPTAEPGSSRRLEAKGGWEEVEEIPPFFRAPYYLASYSPTGNNSIFDGFGNSLALLCKVGSEQIRKEVADSVAALTEQLPLRLVPAFFPPIREGDPEWANLRQCYRFTFRNFPYEYHNGGLWPMITGFYVCALVRLQEQRLAHAHLDAIHAANQLGLGGTQWGFAEYLNGETGAPGGTLQQTWSAAAAVIGESAIRTNDPIL